MKILKFGGTSLGSAKRMKHVADLFCTQSLMNKRRLIVLSAVSGTTNTLVNLAAAYREAEAVKAQELLLALREKYGQYVTELFAKPDFLTRAADVLSGRFARLEALGATPGFGDDEEKEILAQGEIISTHLMALYLEEQGIDVHLLDALSFMRTVEKEPDTAFLSQELGRQLNSIPQQKLFLTQGYICMNEFAKIDNLQRGGSDYTASLLGAATGATEIQIWTDIDGMHNNDPRIVDRTYPIHELSFEEAAELAYFGAKILHPASVLPAQKANIPVKLLNTLDPDAEGTVIASAPNKSFRITAVAAKDGITAIKIRSSRMLLAYGFLRKIFEIFEKYKTPIDVVTTSEVAVSLTIDDTTHLEAILTELKSFGMVEFDTDQTILCVVGHALQQDTRIAIRVLQVLKDIPVRMISYGGSKHNISLVFHRDFKNQAMQALNDSIFFSDENHE